jgi:AP endonuclease-1
MSRRSTRRTSRIVPPQEAAEEESLSGPATAGARNGTLKGKKRSIAEEGVQDSESLQSTPKRSKKGASKSNTAAQGEEGDALLAPNGDSSIDTHVQESSTSIKKEVVTSRTKGGDTSATLTQEKKVLEATRKPVSKSEDTKEKVKEEDEQKRVAIKKQKPAKGKSAKSKESEEMPLAARTTGLKMFVGAHVSAAQGLCGIAFP